MVLCFLHTRFDNHIMTISWSIYFSFSCKKTVQDLITRNYWKKSGLSSSSCFFASSAMTRFVRIWVQFEFIWALSSLKVDRLFPKKFSKNEKIYFTKGHFFYNFLTLSRQNNLEKLPNTLLTVCPTSVSSERASVFLRALL